MGYACDDGQCQADSCEADADCETGVCTEGICQNPSSCTHNDDCLPRTYCGSDGECVADPCNEVDCERGVCERGTEECVGAETCTAETEKQDCLDGQRCANGTCVAQEDVCEELDCQRGVCDEDAAACVDPETCTETSDCTEGSYCNDAGECEVNVCDDEGIDCPRGECDAATGECVDPDSCSTSEDCLDGSVCVQDDGPRDLTCRPRADACMEGGCPGTQVCDLDEEAQSAECIEDDEVDCTSALDCVGDRVCNGRECTEPTACEDDALEPNDTAEDAVDLQQSGYVRQGGVAASICDGDTDVFTYDLSQAGLDRGTFTVRLNMHPRHIGNGELEVTVHDSEGDLVDEGQVDDEGKLALDMSIGVLDDAGVYTITVAGVGEVRTHGIDYELSARYVEDYVLARCDDVTPLQFGVTTENDTTSAETSEFGSSCASDPTATTENIYAIEVDEPSEVTIEAEALDDADIALSLRGSCFRDDSEMACRDRQLYEDQNDNDPDLERIVEMLSPGTYFIMVEGSAAGEGGAYEIRAEAVSSACSPADNFCGEAGESRVCTGPAGFEREVCSDGCNPDNGRCFREPGATCEDAVAHEASFTETLDFGELSADMELGPASCLSGFDGQTPTDGPDKVYAIALRPDHGMTAELDMAEGERGVMYLLSGCADATSSCTSGVEIDGSASADNDPLTYLNDSSQSETVMLVVDAPGEQELTTAELDVHIGETTCSPRDSRCIDDVREECNDIGTFFVEDRTCNFGCEQGACNAPTNDSCEDPLALSTNTTVNQLIDPYADDYDAGEYGCVDGESPGKDAVYEVTTTEDDKVVTVDVQAGFDAAVYTLDYCGNASAACSQGADAAAAGETETLSFYAPTAGDYLVVVDSKDSSANGFFEISATVGDPECDPSDTPTCDTSQSGTLSYCSQAGTDEQYTCPSGTCTDGACEDASGDECLDAIAVNDGDTVQGDFSGTDTVNMGTGRTGQCAFESRDGVEGQDTFYRIDLAAGDLLEASLTTDHNDARLYFLESCDAKTSCQGGPAEEASQTKYYHSEAGGPVYVAVDRENDGSTSDTFSLSFDVTSGRTCAPETATCKDANTVQVCNLSGTAYETEYDCAAGCSQGACENPPATSDTCANATNIGNGTVVYGNYDDYGDDVAVDEDSCLPTNNWARGNDAIYQVDLTEGAVLQAELVSLGNESPVLYLISDCADAAGTCEAGAVEQQVWNTAELTYVADEDESLFLVVDSEFSSADEGFRLSVDIRAPECTPGTSVCAGDGATLRYCNTNGIYTNVACSSGTCSNDTCDSPDNDLCLEAEPISDGDTVTGTWTGTNDRFIDEGRHGQCIFPDYEHPEGPDSFYRIDLQAGDLLTADLASSDSQALLYFLEDCTNSDTCVGGGFEAADQTQQYYADSDGPVTIAVGRGSTSTNSNSFDLSVDVQSSMTCRPNETACIDANTVGTCNDSGDGFADQYNCHAGCNLGACDDDSANANTCSSAPLVGAGTYIVGNYDDLTNDVTIAAESCTGQEGDGYDAVYRVDVTAGDVLKAKTTSYESDGPMVYIVEDCADPTDTCLAGDARSYSGGDTAEAAWAADATQTVYVVVDSTSSSPDGPFSLEIEVGDPECSVGDQRCSPDDSTVIEYCQESLTYATYECTGSCTNGTCDNPTGDECIDAIPLAPGESFTGSYSDMSESLNPGVGTCIHTSDNEMRGRDAVFAMDLTQGQVVRATLERSSDYGSPADGAGMYVLDNCAGDERDTCLWAEPQSDELEFHADQDGTYYLVADYDQYGYADFTLTLEEVTTGAICQPGETSCDPATGELSLCDTTGSSVRSTGTCPDGCEGTQCAAPASANTTCADAYKLDGSTRLVDTYDRFTNDLSLDSCGVTSSDTSGPDAVYEVDLAAGEAVDARVNVMTDYSGDPTVYIVTDCTDTDATCLAGEVGSENKTRVGYEASTAETVYIVVDTDSSYNTYDYELDVNVVTAECSAGDATCADSDTLLSCSDYGVYQPNECSFGCANDACEPPPNDDCSGAIDVPVDSTTYRFSSTVGSYSDNYDLGDAAAGSCVLTSSGYEVDTPGQDAVYKVNASVGTIITAEFVPDFDQSYGPDGILWVSEECPGLVDGCSAGAAPGLTDDSTTLTFVAPEAKTYYIVADVDDTGATGGFHVDISAESRSCIPGTTASCNGDDLEYCNDLGTGYDSYTCSGGCNVAGSSPSCGDPAGEICADALDAAGGGTFTVDMSTMNNDFDLAPGGCTRTSTSAKDVVLEIPVQDGEYVEATATPTASGDDPMLYFLSDCSSAATDNPACAGASDSAGDDQPETVGHKAQETGSLFLVVDGRYTNDLSGNVDVDITISPELCTPGAVIGCDDSSTLRYCNNLGTAEQTYTCSGQCDASSGTAECTQPTGDICPDAIDATGGGSFTVDMSTMSNEYDMKGLSCTGEPMPAGDAVYRMDVTAGDQVTIEATPGPNDDPALYILDDCTAGSNSTDRTCLAGVSEGYGGKKETLVYDVVEDGTIFVVADADDPTEAVETWTVDITVK